MIVEQPHARLTDIAAATLASVLDQSVDCVKLLGLDSRVRFMNTNGLCAMEVGDFANVVGAEWASLWPEAARDQIEAACDTARRGETARFEAFCPTAKGSPRWWSVTVSAVRGEGGDIEGMLSISRDVSERRAAHEAMKIAAAELRHRLKNTYQIVVSLLNAFAQGDPATEGFARDMGKRLTALGKAQSVFASEDLPSEVGTLIPALVTPFASPLCRIEIGDIDAVTVDQGQADAIALVLGELSVNSTKHGAMAHGGRISIAAKATGAMLEISWAEDAVKPVANRSRVGGQGLLLVERIVEARGGRLDFGWDDHGPRVLLRVPIV